MPPECANACAVVHTSVAGANGLAACRLLVFGGSVGDGIPVRVFPMLSGRRPSAHCCVQAMRVHGIDYGAFLKSQAAPAAVSVVQFVDEQMEPSEAAVSADDAGSAPFAVQVAPVKPDSDKQRPKIDGSAAEKKPKEKGGAALKGAPKKGNK
jgi:hypothetical protein